MKPTLQFPVDPRHPLTSPRWWRILQGHGRHWHTGIDIGAPAGTSVVAAAGGVVHVAQDLGDGFGNQVIIRHRNGLYTRYAHLHSINAAVAAPGKAIVAGTVIGTVGNTGRSQGPHLHFDVMTQNPGYQHDLDPLDHIVGGWAWAIKGIVRGNKTPRVRALQVLLNRYLRPEDAIAVDDTYGNQTQVAIGMVSGGTTVDDLIKLL